MRERPDLVRSWGGVLLVLVIACSLFGCAAATAPLSTQSPEERLAERARAYWEARKRRDLVAQYSFEQPFYRERVSLTAFAQGRGATVVRAYEIKAIKVKEDAGLVSLRVTYRPHHPRLRGQSDSTLDTDQPWVHVEREWYLSYKRAPQTGVQAGPEGPPGSVPPSGDPKGVGE